MMFPDPQSSGHAPAMFEGRHTTAEGPQREDGVLLSELSCSSHRKLRTEKDKLGVMLPGVLMMWRPAVLEFKVILS